MIEQSRVAEAQRGGEHAGETAGKAVMGSGGEAAAQQRDGRAAHNAHVHTCTHTHTHTPAHTLAHTHTHTHARTHTRTHKHARTRAHAHTVLPIILAGAIHKEDWGQDEGHAP